jgi:hypothetical protein
MQEEKLQLRGLRVGALPILNRFIARMGLGEELPLALRNAGYADAILALMKSILIDRKWQAVGETICRSPHVSSAHAQGGECSIDSRDQLHEAFPLSANPHIHDPHCRNFKAAPATILIVGYGRRRNPKMIVLRLNSYRCVNRRHRLDTLALAWLYQRDNLAAGVFRTRMTITLHAS